MIDVLTPNGNQATTHVASVTRLASPAVLVQGGQHGELAGGLPVLDWPLDQVGGSAARTGDPPHVDGHLLGSPGRQARNKRALAPQRPQVRLFDVRSEGSQALVANGTVDVQEEVNEAP